MSDAEVRMSSSSASIVERMLRHQVAQRIGYKLYLLDKVYQFARLYLETANSMLNSFTLRKITQLIT